jgi:hypothetical protein
VLPLLTLLLLTAGNGPPREPVVLTRDLAALGEAQALALRGGRHRFRLVRDSDPDEASRRSQKRRARDRRAVDTVARAP